MIDRIYDWIEDWPRWQVWLLVIVLGVVGLCILQLSFEISRRDVVADAPPEPDNVIPFEAPAAAEPEPAAEGGES